MTKDIEREAFEAWYSRFSALAGDLYRKNEQGDYVVMHTSWAFSGFLAGIEREKGKLEGCVVLPESEYNDLAKFKDLYRRAIVNAKKRKNQINWAHVSGLGVGSGRAVDLCKELKIDPHATDMNVKLEAARGVNEQSTN